MDGFCNGFSAVVLHPLLCFIHGTGKFFNRFPFFFNHALFGHKNSVWYFSGFFTKGSNNMAYSLFFKSTGSWLKKLNIFSVTGLKSTGNIAKVNILLQVQVLMRINAMILQHKFTNHLRHTANTLAKKMASLHVIPCKIRFWFLGNEKGSICLRQLSKINGIISGILCIYVDGCFRAHKRYINAV